ncbi:MAG: LysR substrate-binding domain-containing protein, partial [Rhodobacteraceae bacterium]|nr:LysR substrate-binding domain-containing protein [Paracoccaceae bacterium]
QRGGPRVFQRRSRGVSLTPVGAALAERAGEALEILREAFAEARGEVDERLEISTLATFATHVLAPRIADFQKAHPAFHIRISIDHRLVDLQAGEATLAVRAGRGTWPGIRADYLMPSTYTPMISPAFVERFGRPQTPADLLNLPLIDADDPGWAGWFALAGLKAPDPGNRFSLLGTQLLTEQATRAGQGVGLLTPIYYHEALCRGDLIQPFDSIWTDDISIYLAYPERRRNAPAIRAFRAWITGVIDKMGAAPSR